MKNNASTTFILTARNFAWITTLRRISEMEEAFKS